MYFFFWVLHLVFLFVIWTILDVFLKVRYEFFFLIMAGRQWERVVLQYSVDVILHESAPYCESNKYVRKKCLEWQL